MKISFSKASIKALAPPDKGRDHYRDTRTPKLYVRVTPRGVKSFYYVTKHKGRTEYVRLGAFPDMSVTAARLRAEKTAARFALDGNPAEERRRNRSALTLGDLWLAYRADYVQRSNLSLPTLDSQWNVHLKAWEKKPLSAITTQHVAKLRRKIAASRSKSTANRILAMGKAMFAFANRPVDGDDEKGGLGLDVADPFKPVGKSSEGGNRRKARLHATDFRRFFAAIDTASPTMRDFFLCCTWIGARAGNVKAMRWVDLDLDGGTWLIPTTKSGESVEVALASPVVEILSRRRADVRGPYVFPAKSASGHMETYRKAWQRVCVAASLPDLHLHDMRRTLASFAQEANIGVAIMQAQLGHKDPETTLKHYTTIAGAAQRLAIEETVNRMQPTATDTEDAP